MYSMDKVAPNFQLLNQDGVTRKLKDYRNRWLVLYFYPKDNSPGCTKEACAFRDEYSVIAQFGNADIIGINKDSVTSHKKFAEKHRLNFSLLSDPNHEVTKAYGAWKTGKVRLLDRPFATRRTTFIINPEGKIVKKYAGINPKHHAAVIINDLQALQGLTPPN